MNFATLKTNVENYLLDLSTETESLVGDWVNQAIRTAAERYNFRFMENTHEVTTAEATRKLDDKPSDWKESRAMPWLLRQDGSSDEIRWAPSHLEMVRLFGEAAPAEGNAASIDSGTPEFILETEDELHVYPFPDDKAKWDDGNYRVRIPYWAYPADLSAGGDSNWITDNMAFYVIFYATSEGMLFNRDEQRASLFAQRAEMEFRRGKTQDKRSYLPDNMTLGVSLDVYGSGRAKRRL